MLGSGGRPVSWRVDVRSGNGKEGKEDAEMRRRGDGWVRKVRKRKRVGSREDEERAKLGAPRRTHLQSNLILHRHVSRPSQFLLDLFIISQIALERDKDHLDARTMFDYFVDPLHSQIESVRGNDGR